jgi:hypothetical protein
MKSYFTKEQFCMIENIFNNNKAQYTDIVNKLLSDDKNIKTKEVLNNDDISDGCKRYYKKQPPFSEKQNEWKDFMNQKVSNKWISKERDNFELWIFSNDNDYQYMNEIDGIKVFKAEVSNTQFIKSIIKTIQSQISSAEKLQASLLVYLYNEKYWDLCYLMEREYSTPHTIANIDYVDINHIENTSNKMINAEITIHFFIDDNANLDQKYIVKHRDDGMFAFADIKAELKLKCEYILSEVDGVITEMNVKEILGFVSNKL